MAEGTLPFRLHAGVRSIAGWRLLQTYRALHLFGRFQPHSRCWVTPAIVSIDVSRRIAVAQDGAVYQLIGDPGSEADGAQFIAMCCVFDERLRNTQDVTGAHFCAEGTCRRDARMLEFAMLPEGVSQV